MYVDILILANLALRPQHGYEIKKNVEQVAGREVSLNNGMLYPALRRFEALGAVERVTERQQGKPDRHIYHLTPLGERTLRDLLCAFPPEVARVSAEFLVRVSFFEQLQPLERLAILDARRIYLRQALAHHERIREKVSADGLPFPTYAQQALDFQERQTRAELEWVESLAREIEREHSAATPAPSAKARSSNVL